MSRVRVVVTAEDIEAGVPAAAYACPLALALRRAGYPLAQVAGGAWWPNSLAEPYGHLSEAAFRFESRFDSGKPVQPATFYFQGPDK